MIDFQQVSKRFGTQEVLVNASFRVNDGERVGIVGPNGAGKSTVFSLICGDISPDKGTIELPRSGRIAHLRQQFNPHAVSANLLEYAETGRPDLQALEDEIHAIEAGFAGGVVDDRDSALARLGELQTQFETDGGYEARARAETALCGLGFTPEDFERPFRSFSGGWQMRAELARVLVSDPLILLLDEPTNYLDIPAIEWMQKYLKAFDGTMLLISHDRYLLNTLTGITLEIANTEATKYPGNYDWYVKDRALRYEQRETAEKNQQREIERAQRFINRYRADKRRASLVQSKIKQLERMEKVVVPRKIRSPGRIRLKKPERAGQEIIRLDGVGVTYDGERWVLDTIDFRMERGDKLAVIGPNGMGKSTLLRVLAGKLEPSAGTRYLGHKVTVGYQSQEFAETMDPNTTVLDTLRRVSEASSEQELRTLLGGFGFPGDAVEKHVCVLSGGEKIRLAFARLLVDPPNFLVLDEPTTHLDIAAREALEEALSSFAGTVCLVSHDIEFVRRIATTVITLQRSGLRKYFGGYDYYCQKRDEDAASVEPAEPAGSSWAADRKARRRERAEAVQKRGRRRRRLQKRIADSEKRIENLETERAELMAQLEQGNGVDYAAVNRRLSELQASLDEVNSLWEQTATELQILDKGE